jgi:hypothetical protein
MGFPRMTGHPCVYVCSPSSFWRLEGLLGTLPFGGVAGGCRGGSLLDQTDDLTGLR